MAALYEDQILGAKQQAETARKLRELAYAQGVPQGQIVGNRFVGPHWTQHIGNLLRQYNLANQEQEATEKADDLTRQRNAASIDLMNKAGMEAPASLLQSAVKPAEQPGFFQKAAAFLRGEEMSPVPQATYKQNVAQNVSPEARENALMQLSFVNPDVGEPILSYMGTKARREEVAAQREADREERRQREQDNRQLRIDMFNAGRGGVFSDSGVRMGTRMRVGSSGGDGSNGDVSAGPGGALGGSSGGTMNRKDVQIMKLPNGQLARVNKRTGDVMPLEAEGNVPREAKDQGRDVPAAQFDASVANKALIKKIDDALTTVDSNPSAFGLKNVVGQTVMQLADPQGVDPRSAVADIGAEKIHDLSGAAVMASEAPRFSPFVPTAIDTPDKIKKNLQRMRKNLVDLETERAKTFGKDSGFKAQLKGPEIPETVTPSPVSGFSIREK